MDNWQKVCINEQDTILQAMKSLMDTGARFCIVVSKDLELRGSLTDGDIRAAILNGANVNDVVAVAMNRNPITAPSTFSNAELKVAMKSNDITHIPVIDEKGTLLKIVSFKEVQNEVSAKENSIILMVGGLGSRLGELTANCPKPMLKLGNKPILEIIIENFKEYGFKNFFLSVNYKSEMIETYFGDGSKFNIKIDYIREKDRMGTAGSLSLYKPINNLPVIVMNGDVLTKVNFSSLINFHNSKNLDACMCTFRHDYQVPFGVVHFDGDQVLKIEEKPIQSSMVNAGIYSLKPELFKLLPADTFYDMPTFLEKIIQEKKRVGTFQVQDYWLDIGRSDDFYRAESEYKNKLK
ncbi:MAG: nucleotidyltransferase family protein [Bacteriovorax sp.]|nr:nucleotidyltransferase family protein [Bacteriovorax sp.]